jgi:hypothetical protein
MGVARTDTWKIPMRTSRPELIVERNLSVAWARAFLGVMDNSIADSLTLAIRGTEGELPDEDPAIRERLNEALRALEIPTIAQTALSIVPYKSWLRLGKPPIGKLAGYYLKELLPRLKALSTKNRHGTYFERLVSYSGVHHKGGANEIRTFNQIDHVVSMWKKRAEKGGRPRQSALQLACFDPAKDHTGAALAGFPCLQQISLTYAEEGTIEINGYYPTQYIFDRAYGNYLGLCQLGHVIANELGVRLTGLRCFTARPELGSGTKTGHRELEDFLRQRLKDISSQEQRIVTNSSEV